MFLNVELLIDGPPEVLEDLGQQVGLQRAPLTSNFSLERLVPFPRAEMATRALRAELATRIRDEVLEPFRRILADEAMSAKRRRELEDELAAVVIRSCEGVSKVRGIPDSGAAWRWRLEHWGCDDDVEPRPLQRPISGEGDDGRIHIALAFPEHVSGPPLAAFDALASRWPAIEMTVLWDGGEKSWNPTGCGMATWSHGVRGSVSSCGDQDREDPYGNLHSLAPLRLATEIRGALPPSTRVRPHVRVDLTGDQFESLSHGEPVDLELGPDLEVSVGRTDEQDLWIPGYRLSGYDYCDPRGIAYDEVWHRIPARVLGLEFVVTLHSADAVDINRAETVLTQGSDPLLEWVRESRVL